MKKHACQKYRYHRVSIKMMTFMKYNENRQRKTSKSFRKKMGKMGKVSEEEKMKLRTDVVSRAVGGVSQGDGLLAGAGWRPAEPGALAAPGQVP